MRNPGPDKWIWVVTPVVAFPMFWFFGTENAEAIILFVAPIIGVIYMFKEYRKLLQATILIWYCMIATLPLWLVSYLLFTERFQMDHYPSLLIFFGWFMLISVFVDRKAKRSSGGRD